MDTKYKFYLPINISEEIYDTNPIDIAKHNFVISSITEGQVIHKNLSNEEFLPLNSRKLNHILTSKKYPAIMQNLTNREIVISDEFYIPGVKSIGFKLGEEFINQPIEETEINDHKISRKLAMQRKPKINIESTTEKHLFENLKKIKINKEKAIKHSYQTHNNTTTTTNTTHQDLTPYVLTSSSDDTSGISDELKYNYKLIDHDIRRHNANVISASKIYNGDFFMVRDNTGFRVHNNLTNISSDLRQFLYVEGYNDALINIDLRNSQPFLLNKLINQYLTLNNQYSTSDINYYREVTSSGQLYDYLLEQSGNTSYTRDEFKKKLFSDVIYCNNNKSRHSGIFYSFVDTFPTVYKIFESYKKDDYRNLAIQLQREESNLIIDKIVTDIIHNLSLDIFILTIHDSIFTFEKSGQEIKEIMEKNIQEAIGLKPTVNIEFISNPNLFHRPEIIIPIEINRSNKYNDDLDIENIKPVRNNFKLHGYNYFLIKRESNIALYEQVNEFGITVGYEVHIIRIRPKRKLPNGKALPSSEKLASTSEFGKFGFTLYTLHDAQKKFNKLLENRAN